MTGHDWSWPFEENPLVMTGHVTGHDWSWPAEKDKLMVFLAVFSEAPNWRESYEKSSIFNQKLGGIKIKRFNQVWIFSISKNPIFDFLYLLSKSLNFYSIIFSIKNWYFFIY